jgi:predicted transposase/invertase (TIGR01784 family)
MYNPKIDLVFRKLFGTDENKDLLISLINSIIEPAIPLTNITIKNPYNLANYVGGKTSIVDIKAQDAEGTWYDIELQVGEHGMYGKRVLFYLSKLFVDQLEQGQSYAMLNKTIAIHLIISIISQTTVCVITLCSRTWRQMSVPSSYSISKYILWR